MKKSKANRFLKIILCVIISFSFWSLNKLSKKKKANISFNINLVDLPENLVLDSISTQKINLKIEGTGTSTSSKKKINISAKNSANNILIINKHEIASQLESNLKIIDFYPDTIFLFTSKKKTKKVPIKHNIEIHFKDSYWIENSITLNPDSILIKGTRKELEKVEFIETENAKLFNVSTEINNFIGLKKNIFFEEEMQIQFYFNVEKYTEGSIEVPIELINYPKNKKILLFPKKALISYLVSEKNYKNITPHNFKVVCDFKNVDISNKTCKITLLQKPLYIQIIHINQKADFLIQ